MAPEINTTFLALAGPGVRHQGVNNQVWSDHTDIQPTMVSLLGLHDDYTPDGRVLAEVLQPGALPPSVREDYGQVIALGDAYSAINAPVGPFGLDTLKASTTALASDSPGDATYTSIENSLARLGEERDAVASALRAELYGAYGGHPLNATQSRGLLRSADVLFAQAAVLAR